ncbi:hypothetical protein EDC01DRAFT_730130 [Geopyxis carbonaria]|nr:hypothetical protein EDC01DRAFT_730130 [Geopyxis carbonaria]
MSSTPPLTLTPADRAFFQRIINLYHRRLLAAWKAVTGGTEAVPESHVAPPSIAEWPNDKLGKALSNYKNHLDWFEVVEGVERDNPVPNSILKGTEWLLLYYALRLLKSDPPVTHDFMTDIIGTCERHLVRWESCCYPGLESRWDKLRMKGETAHENRPAGGGNASEG